MTVQLKIETILDSITDQFFALSHDWRFISGTSAKGCCA